MTEGFKVEEPTVSRLANSLNPCAATWEVILSGNLQENLMCALRNFLANHYQKYFFLKMIFFTSLHFPFADVAD